MQLRPYQTNLNNDVHAEWSKGSTVVAAVLPTGGGKTVCMGKIIEDHITEYPTPVCAIAHRQELVGQISMSLAKYGIRHRIIAPTKVIKKIVQDHMEELGTSWYDPNAHVAVAGVDTLARRYHLIEDWCLQVGLWVIDECHHILAKNKWGKVAEIFPNARGLGVTATLCRADGNGLGSHADGLIDSFVEGPTMRELIDMGYLCDYKIYAPVSNLDLSKVNTTATGDYNRQKLSDAVQESTVIGDVVEHYLRITPGKLGVTFAPDVKTASEIAAKFNANGVVAEVVSAKTPDALRTSILRRFKRREVMQLVNVDLFGEGFDLPALEVVSMARPTQSYSLYCQQFGRSLRIMDGKDLAIIIDHVGNVIRHGLPDAHREWSLDRREKRARVKTDEEIIPVRACPTCTAVFERIYKVCPFCQAPYVPEARNGPEFVDGDLTELDPQVLAVMRGEIARIDQTPEEFMNGLGGMDTRTARLATGKHRQRQEMQKALRASMDWWAAFHRELGRDDSEAMKRFYWQFGIDVGTAQTLGKSEALALAARVNKAIGRMCDAKETL